MDATSRRQTPSPLDVALGLVIRQRRKALGMSQTDLAKGAGTTFQQIQKYESGFNRVSFSRLVQIAHALECRVNDLIGDLDDRDVAKPLFRQDGAHLRTPGAPELLVAYAAAPPALRKAILKLVLELAVEQTTQEQADEVERSPGTEVGEPLT